MQLWCRSHVATCSPPPGISRARRRRCELQCVPREPPVRERHSPRRLLLLQWSAYGAAGVAFAARSVSEHGESWDLMPRVLAAFPAFHLGHGSGQAVGWLRALGRLRR